MAEAIAKEMKHVLPAFSDPGISIDDVKEKFVWDGLNRLATWRMCLLRYLVVPCAIPC